KIGVRKEKAVVSRKDGGEGKGNDGGFTRIFAPVSQSRHRRKPSNPPAGPDFARIGQGRVIFDRFPACNKPVRLSCRSNLES
ncbi:MAG: hypothetical protein LBT76_06035, partial [Tannerella sp.]|nr:hypothetical protein [Tannerella sp.]